MRNLALVFFGGGLGATGRYLTVLWIQSRTMVNFPWGTFTVNLVGSFVIGIVLGLVEEGFLSAEARLFLAVGILGGFTTFSAFSYENLEMIMDRFFLGFVINSTGQVFTGLIAAYIGLILGRAVSPS